MSALGHFIHYLHLIVGLFAVAITLLGPKWTVPYMIIYWIALAIIYVLNSGCILTRLEQRLTGQDKTVMDGFLRFGNIETTNKNRETFTIGLWFILMSVSLTRLLVS